MIKIERASNCKDLGLDHKYSPQKMYRDKRQPIAKCILERDKLLKLFYPRFSIGV